MKNIHKKVVTIIMVLTLALSCNFLCYASETPVADENLSVISLDNSIFPRYNQYGSAIAVNSREWKTIATSTTGFGCNVQVATQNTGINYVSIQMLGKNGNVLWSETNAIPYNKSRVFECGTDVYKIQAKAVGSNNGSIVSCWNTDKDPGIYNNNE